MAHTVNLAVCFDIEIEVDGLHDYLIHDAEEIARDKVYDKINKLEDEELYHDIVSINVNHASQIRCDVEYSGVKK